MKKNQVEVSNVETIELEANNGKKYIFYIGESEGKWVCFTQNNWWRNLPHFHLECEDRDEAYTVGITAYKLHFEGVQ